uniref:CCHC-type domain-containing protein n=1 Tax=Ditylenchus dipsaci TaxID=166011 RepID=A0A915EVE2_9BILA
MAQKSFCCSVCGKGGHKASQCPVNNMHIFSSQYTALSNRHCFMCHYRGHIVTDCPANVFLNLGINVGDCYVCGSKSHVKKGCPYKFKFWLKGPWRKEVDEIIKLQGSAVNNCNPYWLEIDDMVQEVKVMLMGLVCVEFAVRLGISRTTVETTSLPLPAITWNKSHVFYSFTHEGSGRWRETDLLDEDRRREFESSQEIKVTSQTKGPANKSAIIDSEANLQEALAKCDLMLDEIQKKIEKSWLTARQEVHTVKFVRLLLE